MGVSSARLAEPLAQSGPYGGVDRKDYLLRDSLHAGVVYGRIDQYRLIDTLRVLPESDQDGAEPRVGIEAGGLQSAEGLLLARYFMYSQVYFHPVHEPAHRIARRGHFRLLYERNPTDAAKNPDAGEAVHNAACQRFGGEFFRHDRYREQGSAADFPVKMRDGRIVSSVAESDVLRNLPLVNVDYVFVAPERRVEAERWLADNRDDIIGRVEEDES